MVDQEWTNNYKSSVAYTEGIEYAKPLMKYAEGGSLTSIWGMKSLGINPTDGQELFLKPDGTISQTWKSSDQIIIGNTEPDAQGAFGVNVAWKGFTLYASFLYEFGGDEYNETLVYRVENVDLLQENVDKRVVTERWKKPGDIAKYRAISDQESITRPSSRFVQTYNGVDFNSLTLGYDFKKEWISRMGLSMLRVQFNMKDIGKICNVKQERGTTYPFARTYNFTLNASF